ncbi:POK19 protein, partial [Chordeiles acutipennis]|nr:POK19 protein [Chordeiles acutipennis]
WLEKPRVSKQPLTEAFTVYTDAGKKSRKAVCVWKQDDKWCQHMIIGERHDTLQTLELSAVVWALTNWLTEPLNIVTDSLYVTGVVQRLEDALIRETKNPQLGKLFI